ncbi:DUF4013 domain-containing protein [Methanobacterium aggregans]|uniref:DUF4013 domain-containing protein n=1 Tax=Methanobacterium aggregans TaxID=1615586 RepID=UPI001FD88ED5|nr:DUF4013 domain-containing protein [Methanobacterium aggregans]MBP2046515.1 hypothetical protein [Methanobacterium aggregans]
MDIKFIVRDSLKYPLSDWKKILILGIILFISSYVITDNIITIRNIAEMGLLGIIGLMFGLLAYGYAFRIIKTSLLGIVELPAFDDWVNMFLVGLKVLVVGIVYLIPVILFIIFSAVSSPSTYINLWKYRVNSCWYIFRGFRVRNYSGNRKSCPDFI